jgi:hypothetical protein
MRPSVTPTTIITTKPARAPMTALISVPVPKAKPDWLGLV